MVGGENEIKCGTPGNPCENVWDYPECDPPDPQDGWLGREKLFECDKAGEKDSYIFVVPDGGKPYSWCIDLRTPSYVNDAETGKKNKIAEFLMREDLKVEGDDEAVGGVCRSKSLPGDNPFEFFIYKEKLGKAGFLAHANKGYVDQLHDAAGFQLSPGEVKALANCKELRLTASDIQFEPGNGPYKDTVEEKKGNKIVKKQVWVGGVYNFTNRPERLTNEKGTGIVDILKDKSVEIPGITEMRREELVKHLEDTHEGSNVMRSSLEEGSLNQKINLIMFAGFMILVGGPTLKAAWKWFKGRVKVENYEKEIIMPKIKKYEKVGGYDIIGRDAEATAAWRRTTRVRGFRNVMIDAPTGVGKDVVVEKMALMKMDPNDKRVPEYWRNAPWYSVDTAEFQADTKYRGTVSDKVVDIINRLPGRGRFSRFFKTAAMQVFLPWSKQAKRDRFMKNLSNAAIALKKKHSKVIISVSEIDNVLDFGATTEGSAESPGKTLLNYMTKPRVRDSVLLIGTSSRGAEMIGSRPDLERRFNWVEVNTLSLAKIVEIMDKQVRLEYEVGYPGIEISPDIIEDAARIAEGVYRPVMFKKRKKAELKDATPYPRFDAIDNVLEEAVMLASKEGADTVTRDHLIRGINELLSLKDKDMISESDPSIKALLNRDVTLDQVEEKTAEKLGIKKKKALVVDLPKFEDYLAENDEQIKDILKTMEKEGLKRDVESARIIKGMIVEMSDAERAEFINPSNAEFKKGKMTELCALALKASKVEGTKDTPAAKPKEESKEEAEKKKAAEKKGKEEKSGPHERPTVPPPVPKPGKTGGPKL